MSKLAVAELVYTSDVLASQHIALQQKIQADPGFTWGIADIDRYVLPARGGDISLIVGRPGMGKSTLLSYLALTESLRILARGAQDDEAVVYVTWEGTVDDIYAGIVSARSQMSEETAYSSTDYWWGRIDIDRVRANVSQHGTLPIIMIGFSTLRTSSARLTLDVLFDTLAAIEKGVDAAGNKLVKRKIKLLCADYLQLIPVKGTVDRKDTVAKAIVGGKELGIYFDIPCFFGAQAGRDVDSYRVKLPVEKDLQWSSMGEQHTDRFFGLWIPWKTERLNTAGDSAPMLNVYGHEYPITPNTLFMEMRKQRKEAPHHLWCLHLQPELLRLANMEFDIDRVDLDERIWGE